MSPVLRRLHHLIPPIFTIVTLAADVGRFLRLRLRSSAALAAENLFLRKQLALYESPQANAICEWVLGTLRRECLDFVIPLTETHLRGIVQEWVPHYNGGRPHMALGPGIPQPPVSLPVQLHAHRHRLPGHVRVAAHPILGGLHHEYGLEQQAA